MEVGEAFDAVVVLLSRGCPLESCWHCVDIDVEEAERSNSENLKCGDKSISFIAV